MSLLTDFTKFIAFSGDTFRSFDQNKQKDMEFYSRYDAPTEIISILEAFREIACKKYFQ